MVDVPFSLPSGLPTDPALLATLLDLLPLGVIYYTPVVDAAGTLTDLTLAYLNPAAQRMTQLPAQPGTTYRQQFPTTDDNGAWEFHRHTWQASERRQFEFYYDADGFDSFFRVTAQRLGLGLLVVFTDTRDEIRSQAEQALRESQAREQAARAEAERERAQLQALLTQAPVAIGLFTGDELRVSAINPRMASLLGYVPAELLGHPLFERAPELQGQGFDDLMRQVQATQVPFIGQEVAATVQRQGEAQRVYFNFVYQPLYDANGLVTGIINVAVDVTEQVAARQQVERFRQQAEAALAAAERERAVLQAMLTQAPVAMGLFQGDEARITTLNPLFAAILGRTPEQVLGLPLVEGVPELRGQGFDEQVRRVLRTQVPLTGTETPAIMLRAGQLTTTYYNYVYQPLYNAEGEVLGVLCVSVEVTEQVEARQQLLQLNQELESRVQQRTQQLEAQQQQLQAVFEQAPVAIFVAHGPSHILRVVNPRMSALVGLPASALLGRPFEQALPEVARQGYLDLLDGVWRTGELVTLTESPAHLPHHAPGETGYYTFVYQALRDAHGQPTGILCVAVDVSEQVVARQQVQHLNRELTATNEELHENNTRLLRTNADLDTFIYTASHDLKTPITNIEGLLLALREALPAGVQQEELVTQLLTLLDDTVHRFRFTITQLTDLVRLQQSQTGPAEPVRLGPLVEAVCLDLAAEVQAAEATVHLAVPAELHVSFAPANLRSIVYNLLSNAVKYRDASRPAQVWVRAEQQPGAVVLEIQDNGLGLDATQQQRLFQVFQRLHTHVEGTGVGLYMIKRLIENGGGHIAVRSELGVGTTFAVTFRA